MRINKIFQNIWYGENLWYIMLKWLIIIPVNTIMAFLFADVLSINRFHEIVPISLAIVTLYLIIVILDKELLKNCKRSIITGVNVGAIIKTLFLLYPISEYFLGHVLFRLLNVEYYHNDTITSVKYYLVTLIMGLTIGVVFASIGVIIHSIVMVSVNNYEEKHPRN